MNLDEAARIYATTAGRLKFKVQGVDFLGRPTTTTSSESARLVGFQRIDSARAPGGSLGGPYVAAAVALGNDTGQLAPLIIYYGREDFKVYPAGKAPMAPLTAISAASALAEQVYAALAGR